MKLLDKIKKYNNRVALIDENLSKTTYSQLLNYSLRLQKFLKERSIVFLIGKNNLEWIVFYLAALEKKVILFLIEEKINDGNLNKLINLYKPNFIFKPKYNYNFDFKEIYIFNNYHLLKSSFQEIVKKNINNLCLLIGTSGSTGNSKYVKISKENIESNTIDIIKYLKIKKGDRIITTLPPHYSYGLSLINTHLFQGGSIILNNMSIVEKKFWQILKRSKASTFGAVPFQLEILDKMKIQKINFAQVRYITHAGGSLNNSTLVNVIKSLKTKKIKFFSMYGQTEASPRMSYLDPKFNLKKLGSIGKAITSGKFKIIDNNGREINQSNRKGELIYLGKNVSLGYANDFASLNSENNNKGKLNTGDIAYKDEDGFYYISGRKNRFVKIFGNRINLDDIEQKLNSIGIKNICVNNKDIIYVCIVSYNSKEKIDNRFISKIINIHFSKIVIKFINEIPKTTNGKVAYTKLLA